MNNRNTIYASLGLLILVAATSLALWYAYLTKQKVGNSQTKTFDPLVVSGSSSGDGTFNNDTVTEKDIPGREGATSDTGNTSNSQSVADADVTKNSNDQIDGNSSSKNSEQNDTEKTKKVQKNALFKIYEGPVAGYTTYKNKDGELIIRFIERQKGNVVDVPLKTQKVERISNQTIVGVQRAFFPDESHVVIQHLDDDDSVLTLSTPIDELREKQEEAPKVEVGTYLPVNIQDLTINSKNLFFMSGQEDGTTQLVTTSLLGEKSKRLWKSPLRGWQVTWSSFGNGSLLIAQKPSERSPGYVYRLNPTTGAVTKLFGDEQGITIRENRQGTEILKTVITDDGVPHSSLYTVLTGKSTELPHALIPSKCAWSESDSEHMICGVPTDLSPHTYPDAWYQGSTRYVDTIMSVSRKNGSMNEVIFTDKAVEGGLDVTQPEFTADGTYFFFIDKTTGTLWAVNLS